VGHKHFSFLSFLTRLPSQRSPKQIIASVIIVVTLLVVIFFWQFPMAGFYVLSFFMGESGDNITFTVRSTDDDCPVLIYDQGTILYSRHPFAEIDIRELSASNPEVSKSVWSIREDESAWNTPLESLTYGQCPHGFKQTMLPQPLLTGHYYCQSGVRGVIAKVGPKRYEVIPHWDFFHGARIGRPLSGRQKTEAWVRLLKGKD
jgi:hypothetical protein